MEPVSTAFEEIARLSDRELLARVQVLADKEREATTALIAHLAVMDERRLHLGEGCSSLFTYCVRVLHYSESAAYRRVEAARIARRFPVILEMLSAGRINLTTIRLLAPELTPGNHRELLEEAAHKSRLETEKLIARLRPQGPVPSTVRRLPTHAASLEFPTPIGAQTAGGGPANPPASPSEASPTEVPLPELVLPGDSPRLVLRPPARSIVVPLSPSRYRIQFTATEETHDLLRRAQDLLRHQLPSGDVGVVVAKALQLLVTHLEREKIAATAHPRVGRAPDPRSRHIPAEVRRSVWQRDGGRCAFLAGNGLRCTERAFLEFHHVVPYAGGGEATQNNIELRCRAHNSYEAALDFGPQRAGAEG